VPWQSRQLGGVGIVLAVSCRGCCGRNSRHGFRHFEQSTFFVMVSHGRVREAFTSEWPLAAGDLGMTANRRPPRHSPASSWPSWALRLGLAWHRIQSVFAIPSRKRLAHLVWLVAIPQAGARLLLSPTVRRDNLPVYGFNLAVALGTGRRDIAPRDGTNWGRCAEGCCAPYGRRRR